MPDTLDGPASDTAAAADVGWSPRPPRPLAGMGDLARVATRWPLARALAAAALRDPASFRIAAIAIRKHGALQKPLELLEYVRRLRRRRIRRCLEIGVAGGGTFYAHAAVTAPGGHLLAVDAHPQPDASDMTARCTRLAGPTRRVTCVWRDSHDSETAAQVAAALGGEPLDVLFLDGDHSAEGIARDYALYAPLVVPGGLIAVHDIAGAEAAGVPAFWRSLAARHEHEEIVDRAHAPHGLGIGILVAGAEGARA